MIYTRFQKDQVVHANRENIECEAEINGLDCRLRIIPYYNITEPERIIIKEPQPLKKPGVLITFKVTLIMYDGVLGRKEQT